MSKSIVTKKPLPLPEVPGAHIRRVSGFPFYAVTDDGRILSCQRGKWVFLDPPPQKYGHKQVTLYRGSEKQQIKVHTLVLEAFVGKRPDGMEACHFPDKDPSNNRLSNLRWGTKKDNINDRRIHKSYCGSDVHTSKLTASQVTEIRKLHLDCGVSQCELARRFGVSQASISAIILRKTWWSI